LSARDRSDAWIIGLVLVACASVLAAPIAGRSAYTAAAHVLAVLGACAGLAAFATAAAQTLARLRGAKRPAPAPVPQAERKW
jgi:hypothetical protein